MQEYNFSNQIAGARRVSASQQTHAVERGGAATPLMRGVMMVLQMNKNSGNINSN